MPDPTEAESSSSPQTQAAKANRPRIAKACSSCGKQKLKCDGAQPCSRCEALGCTDQCVYLPSLRGKTRKRRADREREQREKLLLLASADAAGPSRIASARSGGGEVRDVEMNIPAGEGNPDPHRKMWERSKIIAATGARNSALWEEQMDDDEGQAVPEYSISPSADMYEHRKGSGSGSLPTLNPCGGSTQTNKRSSTVDKLTTTLPLPGDAHNPLAVLVELSEVTPPLEPDDGPSTADGNRHSPLASVNSRIGATGDEQGEDERYYAPLQRTLKDEAPHIMSLINSHEAKQLFEIYFNHLHPHLPFLDRSRSAIGTLARRNNFLFNSICCAAARSFNVVLWERLKDFTRFEMERLPKEKSIDVVQGHLIYTCWNLIRPQRFEQDMTWLRAGIASRTAIDIALHRVGLISAARQGLPSWLLRSIIRTWLLCFVVDRTLCIQLGKPTGRQWENDASKYVDILRGGSGESKDEAGDPRTRDDVLVAALTDWALIVTRAVDSYRTQELIASASVLNDNYDLAANLGEIFTEQLHRWKERSIDEIRACAELSGATSSGNQVGLEEQQILTYFGYGRMVIQSLALQDALDRSTLFLPSVFAEYQSVAIQLVDTIANSNRSTGARALRGVPDFVHSALTYAATSLLRCTQNRFAHLHPDRTRIFGISRKAAELLGEAAIGADHIAAVQSAFISRLISVRDVPVRKPTPSQRAVNLGRTDSGVSVAVGRGGGGQAIAGTASSQPSQGLGVSPDTGLNRPPEAIDFEAFARALGADSTLTPWPPLPPMSMSMSMGNGYGNGNGGAGMPGGMAQGVQSGTNGSGPMSMIGMFGQSGMDQGSSSGQQHQQQQQQHHMMGNQQPQHNQHWNDNAMGRDQHDAFSLPLSAGAGAADGGFAGGGSFDFPTGLEAWVSQQGLALSGTGLGPGVGDFLGTGVVDGDMGFVNEAFWQSVFQERPQGGNSN